MLADRAVLLQTPKYEPAGGNHPRSTISPAFNGDRQDRLDVISFCGQVYKSRGTDNDHVKWIFSYATKETNSEFAVRFAVGIKGTNIELKIGSSTSSLKVTC